MDGWRMKPFITIWSRIRLTAGPRDAAGRDRTRVRVRCTSAQRWPRRPSCNTAPCRWSAPHWPDRRRSHDQSTTRTRPGARCPRRRGPNAGGGGGEEGSGSTAIRRAWWGNPTRDEMTEQVVEAYAEVDDSVTISTEPGEWNGYWDKLATQTAGGDLPDVIQMDEKYI